MSENEGVRRSSLVLLRQQKELTQEDLAKALGVTDHTIRNWEKGRAEPRLTIKQVKALCKVLECELNELPDTFGPA
ncbi:helix-turn-helix transcriptional regulator [Leptolyngbya sp. CCY15150]|uniref:helix-turn-helix transcriptional regulator n=1 Tax=Leptolyngbya sp. CCY15150 TaxID=2767772 RepID=UPI0019503351|nr:helix-turn-helix transcriptional regulator [Leptolyngbya sp. CCY15150]